MAKRFDILGIGCVAVDDLFAVDVYPQSDTKLRVKSTERHFGGLTGTALVAAAKLGAKCAFAGLLGTDELSRAVEENFVSHGIDVSGAVRRPDVKPIHSFVVVAHETHTRNIFYDLSAPIGADPNLPNEKLIHSSRVLFLDHLGVAGGLRAAQVAREAEIPVVADFEEATDPLFPGLLEQVDHLVVSETFALRFTGTASAAAAIRELWTPNRDAVVVTGGKEGCWYASCEEPMTVFRHPAFAVYVRDTTGCGDVFHGAYAFALARGDGIGERIAYASAAAALKATKSGGQAGAPTGSDVAELQRTHPLSAKVVT